MQERSFNQDSEHLSRTETNIDNDINNVASKNFPIHFFTIVLNGEPFIRYHIQVFSQLPFLWHWHVVEGVADLKHDTAWSFSSGGRIANEIHRNGRSNDGTTKYLDEVKQLYPENVTIYRQPEDVFWDGKREMVNAPLINIKEECLLWQVDADELWTANQICTARKMFVDQPEKTAAFYWCWYFVGEKLVVSTRNCYTQDSQQEWLRSWRFKPGAVWTSHEPPTLVETLPDGKQRNIAEVNPFIHAETEEQELVFQHFAYVTLNQVLFKEQYYGYKDAVSEWVELQEQTKFPVLLRKYLSWVQDETQIDRAGSCGVVPIARRKPNSSDWQFLQLEELQTVGIMEKQYPKIAVDRVFFQFWNTGIARVWMSLLEEWAENGFSQHIVVFDRAGSVPKIPGIRYRSVPPYHYDKTGIDSKILQHVCNEEGADLFISSYYTTPTLTPSVFMAYDMIPEVMAVETNAPAWREKRYAILHASAYVAISQNTASDLLKFFPHISNSISIAYCGVKKTFSPASSDEVIQFKTKHNISKHYFLLVGERFGICGYKNAVSFFKAFTQLFNKDKFVIVCAGGKPQLEPELLALAEGKTCYTLSLSDPELKAAYSGATALAYPSLYEGFGLPVLEAMACGCPVIAHRNSSIPEVAQDAAIYISEMNINEFTDALQKVQEPETRNSLISAGFKQAAKFSWSEMADTVAKALFQTTKKLKSDITLNVPPVWTEFRILQAQLQQQQMKAQLEQESIQVELRELQVQLQNTQSENAAMKTSKFWKLRTLWFQFKKAVGLPVEE